MFDEYKKAIPELVFEESEKLKISNVLKDRVINNLRTRDNRIAELEKNMANIKEHLEQIKKED